MLSIRSEEMCVDIVVKYWLNRYASTRTISQETISRVLKDAIRGKGHFSEVMKSLLKIQEQFHNLVKEQ